jgi:hypothetical protein
VALSGGEEVGETELAVVVGDAVPVTLGVAVAPGCVRVGVLLGLAVLLAEEVGVEVGLGVSALPVVVGLAVRVGVVVALAVGEGGAGVVVGVGVIGVGVKGDSVGLGVTEGGVWLGGVARSRSWRSAGRSAADSAASSLASPEVQLEEAPNKPAANALKSVASSSPSQFASPAR